MSQKLFEHLSRLLEYSGQKVSEASVTEDGATAIVNIDGEDLRIFIAPAQRFEPQVIEYCEAELNY